MQRDEFWQILRQTHAYETDPGMPRSAADRLLGRLSFWYYLKIFRVVLAANAVARKGRYNSLAWADNSLDMLRVAEECGAKVRISGLENIANLATARVYASNHMSMMETMISACILLPFGDLSIVVKESLLKYPFFGRVLRDTGPIAVTRKDPRADLKAVLTRGEEILRKGRSVLIFPQATRSVEFRPDDFNSLGVKLAKRADVPVVPIALKTDFQGNGRIFKDLGPIDPAKVVCFRTGKPLAVEGNGRETHEQCIQFITASLKEWGVEIRSQKSEVRGQGEGD